MEMKIVKKLSEKSWEKIIQHAMACVENDHYLYTYHGAEQISLRFNSIYQVVEAAFDGRNYLPVQTLSSDLRVSNHTRKLLSVFFTESDSRKAQTTYVLWNHC